MEKNSNVFLWEGFKNAKKELNINGFKIRQLKIKEQIDILEKALKNGDESEVFYFILNTEPIDYKISNRELTIGLLDFLLSIATYPGNYEIEALSLIVALVENKPLYKEIIENKSEKILNDASENCNSEIFQRVGNLYTCIKSYKIKNFILQCENHPCQNIQGLIDLFI